MNYAIELMDCQETEMLCAGRLDAWIFPTTIAVGVGLLVIGAWARVARRR